MSPRLPNPTSLLAIIFVKTRSTRYQSRAIQTAIERNLHKTEQVENEQRIASKRTADVENEKVVRRSTSAEDIGMLTSFQGGR